MLKVIIAAVLMSVLTLADGPVLQTGQVKSYDKYGGVVTYGTIKDDGYYRAGAARSYSRNWIYLMGIPGNVVRDNATGLEWQDNESICYKRWVTQANYDAHNYSDTSGDTATTYCTGLTVDFIFNDWRLPNIAELETLVDYTQYHPAYTDGIFNNIGTTHWSSTTSAHYPQSAWNILINGHSSANPKDNTNCVRCVRGAPLIPSSLSRSDEIVTDSTTKLQWQDDSAVGSMQMAWDEAINYCENILTLGGHSDWRLPNENELLSIVNFSRYDPALNIYVFQNYTSGSSPDLYWSSTTYDETPSKSWTVGFYSGYTMYFGKSVNHSVRCVRGGQINVANPSVIMYLLD